MQRAHVGRLRDCEWKHGEWVAAGRGCGGAAGPHCVGGWSSGPTARPRQQGGPSRARSSGPGAASRERPAPPPPPPDRTNRRWGNPRATRSAGPAFSPTPTHPPAAWIALVDSDWTSLASSWKVLIIDQLSRYYAHAFRIHQKWISRPALDGSACAFENPVQPANLGWWAAARHERPVLASRRSVGCGCIFGLCLWRATCPVRTAMSTPL